jgi:solute carrier family 25 (mitochondrial citrate transporter), member 1
MSSSKKNKNPLTAMTAGCIAGGVEATAVWPMEFIKTQLQLQTKVKIGTGTAAAAPLPYTGMISGLSYTVRTTGFLSLYRGLTPTLLGSIPKAGIRFGLNSIIKDALRDEQGKLTAGKNFLAGLGAGVSEAIIIVAPIETIKTKCIELNMAFLHGMKHILKTEGIGGIYQGVSIVYNLLGDKEQAQEQAKCWPSIYFWLFLLLNFIVFCIVFFDTPSLLPPLS